MSTRKMPHNEIGQTGRGGTASLTPTACGRPGSFAASGCRRAEDGARRTSQPAPAVQTAAAGAAAAAVAAVAAAAAWRRRPGTQGSVAADPPPLGNGRAALRYAAEARRKGRKGKKARKPVEARLAVAIWLPPISPIPRLIGGWLVCQSPICRPAAADRARAPHNREWQLCPFFAAFAGVCGRSLCHVAATVPGRARDGPQAQ
jgi:hypothetical protein